MKLLFCRLLLLMHIILLLFFIPVRTAFSVEKLTFTTPSAPPYGPGDGPGFVAMIATEMFRRINIDIEVISLTAERSLTNVNAGIEDGELSRIAGMEQKYPNLVMVPETMLRFDFMALTRDTKISLAHWDDLAPYTVGMITGWKMFEYNVKKARKIIKVTTDIQLLQMLNLGRIDVALFGRWESHYLLQKLNIDAHLIEPPLATVASFMYLNKKHRLLVAKVSQALAAMKRDGTYQRISEQTLGKYKNRK